MTWPGETYPFADRCDDCAEQRVHHHTGPKTKGMPHEAGPEYCWCLDAQEPTACQ